MILADIDPDVPTKITLWNVPTVFNDVCKTVPGLHWDSRASLWRMALSWTGCLALRSTFRENLEVGESLNVWAAAELETRINPANALRDAIDAPGLDSLYPYQRAGVQFLKTAKQALCADDMGTGKTRQAICTMMEHYREGTNPFPILVVCPNTTKLGWKREFNEVWPELSVTVVDGSVTKRRKQLSTPAHVYIMNWESVRSHSRLQKYGSIAFRKCMDCGGNDPKVKEASCHTHIKELNGMEFNAVIVDEIHRMKDPASQQTRAVKAATGGAPIRLGLSGTPIADTPDDLWSILNWLSPTDWPAKGLWRERMLEVSYDMWGAMTVSGVKRAMKDEFFATLNPRMRRMPKELVLTQLPPVVRETRAIAMPPKQKKAYEQMRDNMIAQLDGDNVDGLVMTTTPMTCTLRMLQFASAYAETETVDWFDEDKGEWSKKVNVTLAMPSNKVDAFMDDLDDFGDSQLVVFASSKQLINLLSEKMTKNDLAHGLITGDISTDDRQAYIDRFQDGKLKYMLCTTAAGGTGITLTKADTVVFLQRPWSMIDSQQAEARVQRIGSEIHESINVIDYVSIDTLDEVVIQTINAKSDRLEEILRDRDLLRRVLETNDGGQND